VHKQNMSTASIRPIPAFINESVGADRGLICGFQLRGGQPPRELDADAAVEALASGDSVTWLHFNLNEGRARRWLLESELVPLQMRELLQEHDGNRRIEPVDDGLLTVMSDFAFEPDADPADVAPLWCFANATTLITARMHPLRGVDDLRLAMRSGTMVVMSGIELVARLYALRTTHLRRRAQEMVDRLDDIEDEILAGDIREQREQLGRTRRVCARWRREFAPERADLSKFLHREAEAVRVADREALTSEAESLGFAIEEVAELYERAKLLQEELASRLAESTGRNLYVLSILTAVLLPMTLVTGIFGMNVAGLPGMHDPGSFWRVMLVVVASGVVTLMALIWRRLL
jgi:zinc transporter